MYVILNEHTASLVLDCNGKVVEIESEKFALKVASVYAHKVGVITQVINKATLEAAVAKMRAV